MSITTTEVQIDGRSIAVHSLNTLVIGSGAAGLNAALQLHRRGMRDIAIITERWGAGTSNNAGSDKQTYYKLSLAGARPDSARQMAEDLFRGGSMHGDIALCEAQHSAQAFFNLIELGVPFPHTRHGAYAGYQTDHDPRGRGTSAGPLTSRMMCECLGRAVQAAGITVFDGHVAVALLTKMTGGEKQVCGAVAMDLALLGDGAYGFVLFNAVNVVMATGGPGGMYAASVYPESQTGSTGMALAIGAVASNLTESQYGLASIRPRWNLSGSYQQVIPRYVSCDAAGGDEREFLNEYFPDMPTLGTAIFRKGYEWPFDCQKAASFGSSLIDLLVYQETVLRGRRVFLDYTRNPCGGGQSGAFSLDLLPDEAASYLRKSQALRPTPIERLAGMNLPAIELFRSHGIDLGRDRLEIAVCAQHSNGGLRGNIWWESNIRHLFPIGEVNGSHGVRRPGGAALNAGQVGGLRAAMYIAARYAEPLPDPRVFVASIERQLRGCLDFAQRVTTQPSGKAFDAHAAIREIQERMSAHAAHVRSATGIGEAAEAAWKLVRRLPFELRIADLTELPTAFRAADLALTHAVYLEAIREYLDRDGQSRGSALVLAPQGQRPCPKLGDDWRFACNEPNAWVDQRILEIALDDDGGIRKQWVDIRPIPEEDDWFETVWNDQLNDRVIR
ncbi:MAG TPA: FAD-binding protein [Phycisphaerae bacterium]|nr:FAD-binding protein [Phycisphaerae bacterium]